MLKKLSSTVWMGLLVILGISSSRAQNAPVSTAVSTLEQYNDLLPAWGVSWAPGAGAINGYYPTFYTGFAMRSQFPERIHVRVARGNQTRVSVILDETTLSDYLFDLVKRYSFYAQMTSGASPQLNLNPKNAKFLPQLTYFNQIIESPEYGILEFVRRAHDGDTTAEENYRKGLEVLTALNPGRVFHLRIDLNASFNEWRSRVIAMGGADPVRLLSNPNHVVTLINSLVFGRINYTAKPSADVIAKLEAAVRASADGGDEFQRSARDLFLATTGTKYRIRILSPRGDWQPALQCSGARCFLVYPEFTAIYPTGSLEAMTTDEFGNRINAFATPGLWQFLNYRGKEVDNIRDEPYYGFAPKMDYEGIGNGFHNPAVRFWGVNADVKKALGIEAKHNTLWAVKRGGVSHGCLRLPLGHLWEMRQIFPVENAKMTKIHFFGSNAQDFDVYDINGDGRLEVMGVQYMISYGLKGTDELARREGTGLEINSNRKRSFYTSLYGERSIFSVDDKGRYTFHNPRVSLPSHLDFKKRAVKTRLALAGDYPLYEQVYEKDKVQFYSIGAIGPEQKPLVRLMGRVRGCAPTSDRESCGEAAFDREARGIVR